MAKIGEFEKEFQQRLEQEARKKGIDPAQLKDTTVHLDQQGKTIFVKWGDVEVTLPAPSEQAVDSWFDKYGGVIVGAFVALVGVALGAVVAVASGGRSSDHQT
jgi:hypothetical protein